MSIEKQMEAYCKKRIKESGIKNGYYKNICTPVKTAKKK